MSTDANQTAIFRVIRPKRMFVNRQRFMDKSNWEIIAILVSLGRARSWARMASAASDRIIKVVGPRGRCYSTFAPSGRYVANAE